MDETKEGFLQTDSGQVKAKVKGYNERKHASFNKLFILTCTVWLSFISHGLSTSIPGATLLDMASLTGSSVSEISWIFTGRSLGGILGALLLPLVSRFYRLWVPLGISQLAQGLLCCLAPLCRTNALMISIFVAIGVTRSFLDAANFVVLLDIWGPANGPWLTGLTCMYGIGALLAPLVAEPFLTSKIKSNLTNEIQTGFNTNMPGSNTSLIGNSVNTSMLRVNLFKAYTIIGAVTIFSGLVFICDAIITQKYWIIYSHNSKKARTKKIKNTNEEHNPEEETKKGHKFEISFANVFVSMLSIYTVAYCLIEHTFGMFLVTFTVEYVKWEKRTAVFLLSIFYTMGTLSRGLVAVLCKWLQAKYILSILIAITVASAIAIAAGSRLHPAVLWATVCSFAIGNSPLFSVGVTYADRYIMVTPMVSAILQVACTTAAVLSPFTIGRVYETVGPLSFIYILIVGSCLLFGVFACMNVLSSRHGERTRVDVKEVNVDGFGKNGVIEKTSENKDL